VAAGVWNFGGADVHDDRPGRRLDPDGCGDLRVFLADLGETKAFADAHKLKTRSAWAACWCPPADEGLIGSRRVVSRGKRPLRDPDSPELDEDDDGGQE
jgi:hypothetical protein